MFLLSFSASSSPWSLMTQASTKVVHYDVMMTPPTFSQEYLSSRSSHNKAFYKPSTRVYNSSTRPCASLGGDSRGPTSIVHQSDQPHRSQSLCNAKKKKCLGKQEKEKDSKTARPAVTPAALSLVSNQEPSFRGSPNPPSATHSQQQLRFHLMSMPSRSYKGKSSLSLNSLRRQRASSPASRMPTAGARTSSRSAAR
jgi:hypothetical protein